MNSKGWYEKPLVGATQLERTAKVCSNQKRPYYLYLLL